MRDPRVAATDDDLRAQFELLRAAHQRQSDTHEAINRLRTVRRQAEDWLSRSRSGAELEPVQKAAQAVLDRIKPIEEELIQVKWRAHGDDLMFPARLNGKLAGLQGVIASGDGAPTAGARAVYEDLSARVQTQLDLLSEVLATEVAILNRSIQNAYRPPVGL